MAKVAIKFYFWMPAVMRAVLFCFVTMMAAYTAGTQGYSTKDLMQWGWHEWLILIFSIASAGMMTLVAFLDQTMTYLKNKFGDTQFLTKEDVN